MITKFTAPVNIDILAKYDNIYSALLRVRVALQNKVFLTKVRCEMDAMGFVFVLAFTCLFVCIIFFFCEIKCHKENLPLGASIVAIVLLGIHTGFLKDEVRDQQRQIDQLCKVIPLAMATDRTVGNDEHCTYGKLPKGVYTFCFADYKDGSAFLVRYFTTDKKIHPIRVTEVPKEQISKWENGEVYELPAK